MAVNIPDEMQAVRIVEYNKPYELQTVPVPKDLDRYDLLIKVAVAAFCHSDEMARLGLFGTRLPCTASHEGAGTVVATGVAVQNFKPGDRILAHLSQQLCGQCPDCLGPENQSHYCQQPGRANGLTTDGAFAEYMVVDSRTTAAVPESVSFQTAAPLGCAGCTIFRGIKQSGLQPGQWLAIMGSGGGLGHLGIKFAKALGLKVVAIDARDEGLDVSKEAGADVVVDARESQDKVIQRVLQVTNQEGASTTINVANAKTAAAMACAVTKRHGLMIQIAQPEEVSIPFQHLIFRNVRVQGSLVASPSEMKEMLQLVASRNITTSVTPVQGLVEVPKLMNLVYSGQVRGKAIVIVDSAQV